MLTWIIVYTIGFVLTMLFEAAQLPLAYFFAGAGLLKRGSVVDVVESFDAAGQDFGKMVTSDPQLKRVADYAQLGFLRPLVWPLWWTYLILTVVFSVAAAYVVAKRWKEWRQEVGLLNRFFVEVDNLPEERRSGAVDAFSRMQFYYLKQYRGK